MMNHKTFFLLMLLFMQTSEAAEPSWKATRATSKPVIDGNVEALWYAGILPSDFKQVTPGIGVDASVATQVFLLYDDDAVYIALSLSQRKESVRAQQAKRDDKTVTQGDHVRVLLDPSANGSSAYFFNINAVNAIVDGTLSALGEWETRWDGTLISATSISDSAWFLEMRIPLSTLTFQNKDTQDWLFFVSRHYSQNQEISVLRLTDIHNPFRVADFPTVSGFTGLKKKDALFVTPYSYYSTQSDHLANTSLSRFKAGGEVQYTPSSSMMLLATIRPDYAQLETDREIINVSDVPESYPEKRPFFTSSSDLYPGLAVNTRNIGDITAGLKLRGTFDRSKYDLTTVYDENNTLWALGDFRTSDNDWYYIDLISGLKRKGGETDYNLTTNLRTWMFDRKFTAYTWFGTINSRRRDGNEWESVNAARWVTRTLYAGIWNHVKSQFYNPNIVGHNTLANELVVQGTLSYSFINEQGFLRTITPSLKADFSDVYTHVGNGSTLWKLSIASTIHPSDAFGNWDLSLTYRPKTEVKFRYRNTSTANESEIFEDAYSTFVLATENQASWAFELSTDQSKQLGGKFSIDTKPVRDSKALFGQIESFFRVNERFSLRYTLEFVDIDGSAYQSQYRQTIHRASFEYGIAERMTVRGVVQLNTRQNPLTDYHFTNPTTNLTFSYEYEPGSSLHFVYNQLSVLERTQGQQQANGTSASQSIAIKLSKQLSL